MTFYVKSLNDDILSMTKVKIDIKSQNYDSHNYDKFEIMTWKVKIMTSLNHDI